VDIRFAFAIEKVDSSKRLVSGWATSEDLDRQGDIIPYDVAKEAFADAWTWMGVREMHQNKAVGKLTQVKPDPEGRRIWTEAYISASRDGEDTLTKVKEGILKGFSIGGHCDDFHFEKGARILDSLTLTELSLVDVPANPCCTIELVKRLGGDGCHGECTDKCDGHCAASRLKEAKDVETTEARMPDLTEALLEKAGVSDTQKYLLECLYRDAFSKGSSMSDALSSLSDTLSGSSDPAAQQASAALAVLSDLSSSSSSTSSGSSSSDGSSGSDFSLSSTGSSTPSSSSSSSSSPSSSSSSSPSSSSSSSPSSSSGPSSSSSSSSPSSTSKESCFGKGAFEGAVTTDQTIPAPPAGTLDGGAMGTVPMSAMGVTMEQVAPMVDAAVNARLAAMMPPTVEPQPGIAEQTMKVDDVEVKTPKGDVPLAAASPLDAYRKALGDRDMKKFAELCGDDQGKMDTVKDSLVKSELSQLGITSEHLLTRVGA
jgi:Caudovirus prohead serine protease